uniref:Uncharacterized protein n=1 Tax=Rodentolepis nana TaxID=102285 RepID=A0A0R3TMD9_RODNA
MSLVELVKLCLRSNIILRRLTGIPETASERRRTEGVDSSDIPFSCCEASVEAHIWTTSDATTSAHSGGKASGIGG